jgi:hypothetical protein
MPSRLVTQAPCSPTCAMCLPQMQLAVVPIWCSLAWAMWPRRASQWLLPCLLLRL